LNSSAATNCLESLTLLVPKPTRPKNFPNFVEECDVCHFSLRLTFPYENGEGIEGEDDMVQIKTLALAVPLTLLAIALSASDSWMFVL